MDSLEKIDVLKAIGLDKSNEWVTTEEKSKKFFEFIVNNLDEANVLTNSELLEYETLMEAGKVLNDEELEIEMKNIEHAFPGFFSVNDKLLEELESEAKELEQEINEKSDRLARMKDYEEEQLNVLADLERKNNEIGLKQRLLIEDCQKRSKELAEMQESNTHEVSQLNKIYTQQQTTPTLMSQMPLDVYFNRCNQLLGLLEMYMNQNFNIIKSNDFANEDEESQISSIYQIKTEIIDIEKKKFEEAMNVAGMNYVIDNIESHKNQISGDYYEIRSIVDNLIIEKENLETHLNVLLLEGQMLVENLAEQKVKNVFHEFYKGKNKRANECAEKIVQVYDVTESTVHACELLWVALQLDLNRLKNRVDNTEEMNIQSQDCTKRIQQMMQISKEDLSNSYSHQFLSSFQKLLIENLHCSKDDLSTVEKCFKQYISHDENVKAIMKMLVEQKQLIKIQNSIHKMDEQSSILRELIFCGPTNKPRLYDPKFIVPLHDKQCKKKEFDKLFHELKLNIQNKILQPFTNDKFYRLKELLYIWFMSEPKKVLLAIKEVQNKAAQEGSASFKALNITVNH